MQDFLLLTAVFLILLSLLKLYEEPPVDMNYFRFKGISIFMFSYIRNLHNYILLHINSYSSLPRHSRKARVNYNYKYAPLHVRNYEKFTVYFILLQPMI